MSIFRQIRSRFWGKPVDLGLYGPPRLYPEPQEDPRVSVERLSFYYPDAKLRQVLGHFGAPLPGHKWKFPPYSEFLSHDDARRARNAYNQGRVRHFFLVGVADPIVLVEENGTVVLRDGHHRFWAALIRGDVTVPVEYTGSEEFFLKLQLPSE